MAPESPSKILGFDQQSQKALDFIPGKNWLILIAINKYKIKPLHNCKKDAEKIRDILVERYYFEDSEIIELYDNEATCSKIIETFLQLRKDKIKEHDNVVIYYSGHGIVEEDFGFCWVPTKAENGDISLYIKKTDIIPLLNGLDKKGVQHIFLIIDSCFSGTMLDSTKSSNELNNRQEADPSRWGLTSGRKELVSDGAPGQHSPFAACLIEILENSAHPLRVKEIGDWVMEKMAEKNIPQTPRLDRLDVKGHAGGEMIFHLRENAEKSIKIEPPLIPKIDYLTRLPVHATIGYPELPFKGLRWFDKNDARVFFGRNKNIYDLFQLLENKHDERSRLILLYGPTGSGKSSFLHAGLQPRLPENWNVVYKRRGQDGNAIGIINEMLTSNQDAVETHILILDQLEEIFSNPGADTSFETNYLSQTIKAGLQSTPQLKIILSFREDFLGRIQQALNWPSDTYTSMVINHLNRTEIYEALTGVSLECASQYRNLTYEDPALPHEIAGDMVSLDAKTYTPLIQYILWRMWEKAAKQPVTNDPVLFTRALYKSMHRDSLQDLLDTQIKVAGKNHTEALENGLLEDLLIKFTTDEITSKSRQLGELVDLYRHLEKGSIAGLCDVLENVGLLTRFTDVEGLLNFRLCHDALAMPVVQRYNSSQKPGQQASRFLEQALRTGTELDKGALLIVDRGANGRIAPTQKETELIRKGWGKHIKSLVKDEIGKNEVPKGIEYLEKYNKATGFSQDECILFTSRYNTLARENSNGLLLIEEYIQSKRALNNQILDFLDSIHVNERSHCLKVILKDTLTGKPKDLMGSLEEFVEYEDSSSVSSKIQEISGVLKDIHSGFAQGLFSGEEFIIEYAKLARNLIFIVLGDYVECYSKDVSLLTQKDFIEIIEEHIATIDLADSSDNSINPLKEQFLRAIDNIEKTAYVLLTTTLINLVEEESRNGVISFSEFLYFSSNLKYSAIKLLPDWADSILLNTNSTGKPVSMLILLQMLHENYLEVAIRHMYCSTMFEKRNHELERVYKDSMMGALENGLFLIAWDDYRATRNKHCLSLAEMIVEAFGIRFDNSAPCKELESFFSVLEKTIEGGALATGDDAVLEAIINLKPPVDFTPWVIYGSIESDFRKKRSLGQIEDSQFHIAFNRLQKLRLAYIQSYLPAKEADSILPKQKFEVDEKVNQEDIIKAIENGDYERAVMYLIKFCELHRPNNFADAQLLGSRFFNLEKSWSQEIIHARNYRVEIARILRSIFELIN